jgi:hypothetical protein
MTGSDNWDQDADADLPEGLTFRSPQVAAFVWLHAVRSGDDAGMWRALAPGMRLALAQMWIIANPALSTEPSAPSDRDVFAESLALEQPQHPLTSQCLSVSRRTLAHALGSFAEATFNPSVGTRLRPIAPTLELVRFFGADELSKDDDGRIAWEAGAAARSLAVTCELEQGHWGVAGLGYILRPGWPPTTEQLELGDD